MGRWSKENCSFRPLKKRIPITLPATIKTLLISLLLCTQAVPFYATFSLHLRQYYLLKTAKERLKNERLVCVVLDKAQAEGLREGSEVQVNGKMMDIQSITRTEEKIMVRGWYDAEEDKVREEIEKLLNQQQDEEADTHLLSKIWELFALYWPYLQAISPAYTVCTTSPFFIFFSANLTTVHLPVATPPPLYS